MTNEGNDRYIHIEGVVRFIKISRHATACSYANGWNRTDRWLGSRDKRRGSVSREGWQGTVKKGGDTAGRQHNADNEQEVGVPALTVTSLLTMAPTLLTAEHL